MITLAKATTEATHWVEMTHDRVLWLSTTSKLSPLNRNALAITDTELKLIAAAAIIGLNSTPKNG